MDQKPFFVIRTPRLPLNLLDKLSGCDINTSDVIKDWLALPEVMDALYIASPSLVNRVAAWQLDPHSKQNKKVTLSLLRYMIRMCSRSTPFGLFSGIHKGIITDKTSLICHDYREDIRVSRIDNSFLMELRVYLIERYQFSNKLTYKVNPSHYFIGKSCHYIETYIENSHVKYRLSSIEADEVFLSVIALVKKGIKFSVLVEQSYNMFTDVDKFEVESYIKDLVLEGILCADFGFPITGEIPEYAFIKSLKGLALDSFYKDFYNLVSQLKLLDKKCFKPSLNYKEIYKFCQKLPIYPEENRLIQVDSYRGFEQCSLSRFDLQCLIKKLNLIANLSDNKEHNKLSSFIRRFNSRFEGQCIALSKALDDEVGINIFNSENNESSLLNGLNFFSSDAHYNLSERTSPLQKIIDYDLDLPMNQGKDCIVLNSDVLKRQSKLKTNLKNYPFSMSLLVNLFVDENSKPVIKFNGCAGGHGSSMAYLGRFCFLDSNLQLSVYEAKKREQEHSGDVIFAEIVHLPDGRPGNIIARPQLSEYEIVFMAESSLDSEYQIHISDLYLSVENDKIKLWSKRLNKQIVPRLSCSHNYQKSSLATYKFLCLLQNQNGLDYNLKLSNKISTRIFTPRIMLDNLIIYEKTWRIPREEFSFLDSENENFNLNISILMDKFNLEPHVVLTFDHDNNLQLDITNPEMFNILLQETKGADFVLLKEVLSRKYNPILKDKKGQSYNHELVIPIENSFANPVVTERTPFKDSNKLKRSFGVGSQWLSLKIYSGNTITEQVLLDSIIPFINQNNTLYDKWFFIRYADPLPHLRLRFNGVPEVLYGKLLVMLNNIFDPMLESGLINKIELMTYEREIERYGGSDSFLNLESLFMYDSVLATEICNHVAHLGDDIRWRALLIYAYNLFDLFNYSKEKRFSFVNKLRSGFSDEFNESLSLKKKLGLRYKNNAQVILDDYQQIFIDKNLSVRNDLQLLKPYFSFWLEKVRPIYNELNNLFELEKVDCSKEALTASILHMQVNRVFKEQPRKHEFVIYDFLRRKYFSEMRVQNIGAS